jgi:hypothetical protein
MMEAASHRSGGAVVFHRLTVESAFPLLAGCVVAWCLAVCSFAYGQVASAEQEIRVHDLPSPPAQSPHALDVLARSAEIVFDDKEVCCGKNSALEDSVQSSDLKSLKDIANKLQGRHLLSDGRLIMVTAEYLAPDQVSAGHLVYMFRENRAPLMMWNSHLYIVEGMTYLEDIDPTPAGLCM